ncbi:hypothetical protein LXL04_006287 [Taraxacum kok-saghyz]
MRCGLRFLKISNRICGAVYGFDYKPHQTAPRTPLIRNCKNCQKSVYVKVEEHLILREFMPDLNGDNDDSNNENCDNLSGMLHDCEYDIANEDYENFQELFDESEKPLYDGCTKYTKLSAVLNLFNLKANSRLSDTSFTSLLKFIVVTIYKVSRVLAFRFLDTRVDSLGLGRLD